MTNATAAPPAGISLPLLAALGSRAVRASIAASLALALGSCGGNVTAGGFGEVQVTVSGDAPDTQGASPTHFRSLSPAFGSVPRMAGDDHEDDPEGNIEMEILLYLLRADGGAVAVTDTEIRVELDLAGSVERDVVRTQVPAQHYVGVRILFTELEVEVDGGVIINGVAIKGPIEVELEDDEVIEVERALNLQVRDGERIEVLLDMNARIWLAAIDPDLRVVAERVVAEAIRVQVRP